MGLRIEDVDVIDRMDTAVTPWSITSGTYASRFSVAVVGAVARGARRLGGQLRAIAAELLETAPEDLELVGGAVRIKGVGDKGVSLRQLAGAVQWNRGAFPDPAAVQLQVSESYSAPNLLPPDADDRVNAAATYGFMADLALVEVDADTCMPRVLKYVAVHDVGRVLNEQLVRGQIAGGIVQGIAGALFEECDYDEQGQYINASFMDYLCPTAVEAPAMDISHQDVPSPFTELGVKGCGENSAMSAPAAIASAVEDALAPFGANVQELPLTPTAIWRLMSEVEAMS
jgi:2-furoyl-CoA dehydrogenase large subunit